jgi:hypothetical protein
VWGTEVDCVLSARRLRGPVVDLGCDTSDCEFLLAVPRKIERRFRGQLRLTASAVGLRAVVRMSLETAVASIVAAESPPNAPPRFLEAQAVASRSYLLSGARHRGFDFCDTTHCQYLREPAPAESSAA